MLRESFGADLPAAVATFACLETRPPPEAASTPRRARPLALAHISSASANTGGSIPPLSKSILENRLSFIVVTHSRTARRFHFPFDSQLSDGFLESKPSLSAAALISPYRLTIH